MVSRVLASVAWAQAGPGGGGGGNMLVSLIPFLLIFVLFYFLLIRPQQQRMKKLQDAVNAVKKGDEVGSGSILGTVEETPLLTHSILVPPNHVGGKLVDIASEGDYDLEHVIATTEKGGNRAQLKMYHKWPVRKPRPYAERYDPTVPLVTGQRVIDTYFPIAKGGTGAIPIINYPEVGILGLGKIEDRVVARDGQIEVETFSITPQEKKKSFNICPGSLVASPIAFRAALRADSCIRPCRGYGAAGKYIEVAGLPGCR